MNRIQELIGRYPVLQPCTDAMEHTLAILTEAFRGGGKLLICGNGGSAADADHIVGELMKGFCRKRPLPADDAERIAKITGCADSAKKLCGALPAISLCTHTALLTALVNDGDPAYAFAQQVYGLGKPGDVLLALSTSGSSKNVLLAVQTAKARGLRVLAITGAKRGPIAELADCVVCLPDTETYRVQELTLPLYHALCLALEDAFFPD